MYMGGYALESMHQASMREHPKVDICGPVCILPTVVCARLQIFCRCDVYES